MWTKVKLPLVRAAWWAKGSSTAHKPNSAMCQSSTPTSFIAPSVKNKALWVRWLCLFYFLPWYFVLSLLPNASIQLLHEFMPIVWHRYSYSTWALMWEWWLDYAPLSVFLSPSSVTAVHRFGDSLSFCLFFSASMLHAPNTACGNPLKQNIFTYIK